MNKTHEQRYWEVASRIVALPFLAALLLWVSPAAAAIIPVTTTSAPDTAGDGQCGLLEAVYAAQHDVQRDTCPAGDVADTIALGSGTFAVPLAIEIWSSEFTFQGAGMHQTILALANEAPPGFLTGLTEDDCPPSGVYVSSSATLRFTDLTLRAASGAQNQGVCVASGELLLNRTRVTGFDRRGIWAMWAPNSNGTDVRLEIVDSLIDDNHAYDDGFGGAGIFYYLLDGENGPTGFEVERSSIVNNFSEARAGGLYVGGPLSANGNRHMKNVTISGNFAAADGGGLYYDLFQNYLQLDFVTITNNHAAVTGGGICKTPNSANLQIGGSLITNNTADGDSQQRNLCTDSVDFNSTTCLDSVIYLPGAIWTPETRPLSDPNNFPCLYNVANGGFGSLVGRGGQNNLPVHRLLSGSIGLDSETFGPIPLDGRGLSRPMDGDGNGSKIHDRGAFELRPLQLETETLTVVAKSSDTHSVVNDGCAAPTLHCLNSGGSGTNLQANAVNDFVTYRTASLPTGTFTVSVRFKRAPNGGRFQLAFANSQNGPFTNVGSAQNGFALTTDWATVNLGSIAISSAGQKFFRFTVTGRSGFSAGFHVFPDTIDLVK